MKGHLCLIIQARASFLKVRKVQTNPKNLIKPKKKIKKKILPSLHVHQQVEANLMLVHFS